MQSRCSPLSPSHESPSMLRREGSNWSFRKGTPMQEATIDSVIPLAVMIEIGRG